MKKKSFVRHLVGVVNRYIEQNDLSGNTSDFFRNRVEMLNTLAKDLGKSRVSIYRDFLAAFLLHGEEIEYYIIDETYKYGFRDRKKRLTAIRSFWLDYKYNINAGDEEKSILFDKELFNSFFKEYIGRDWRYAPDESIKGLREFLAKYEKVICKPHDLSWGKGIFILDETANEDELQFLIDNNYIVEEFVENHPDLDAIHSESLNTIRIFSIIDRDGIPHIALPYFRAGIGKSIIDNISAGGVAYVVDAKTGIIKSPGKRFASIERFCYHPGTNIKMVGTKIPCYEEACDMIKKVALMIPTLRFVGWDVAITPNGPLLIEGNIEYAATMQDKEGLYKEARKYL